jgi:nitrogen fixation protein
VERRSELGLRGQGYRSEEARRLGDHSGGTAVSDQDTIRITFQGLLSLYLPKKTMMEVYNAIELSCRRNGWGIAIDDSNRLDFVPMVKVEESK